ncbi:MAG: type II CAAX endopeptidase family protein [Gemmatimonadota bacterium]
MTSAEGDDVTRTPGPRGAIWLLLGIAVLFLFAGVPLQIAFGEAGLIISQLGFLFVPTLLFVRLGRFDPERTLSLRLPTTRQLVGGLLVLLGGVQIAWLLTWIQSLFVPVPTAYLEAVSAALTADSPERFIQLLFMAAALPAVAEEVLFRGVVLSGFRSRLPTFWAIVCVGIVFGLFHLTPQTAFRFLPTAWLGMLLAWVVVVSGSLPLATLLHFVNNAAILSLTALPMTTERVAAPDQAPPFLLLPIAVLALAGGVRLLHQREPRSPAGLSNEPQFSLE